jgi:hypothetical protein
VLGVAGYSGTPLARKLGVTAGAAVLLDGAPVDFDLGDIPDGVTVSRRGGTGPYDVIVCFCPDHARLTSGGRCCTRAPRSPDHLWIAWPKRSSGLTTDLNENVIRDFALSHGRVDVKVCAIDDVWSGLKHVIRKVDR